MIPLLASIGASQAALADPVHIALRFGAPRRVILTRREPSSPVTSSNRNCSAAALAGTAGLVPLAARRAPGMMPIQHATAFEGSGGEQAAAAGDRTVVSDAAACFSDVLKMCAPDDREAPFPPKRHADARMDGWMDAWPRALVACA